jgi:AraC family transcriptional regulator
VAPSSQSPLRPTVHFERTIGPVRISDFTVPANVDVPVHAHQHHHVCVVIGGSFEEVHGATTVSCPSPTFRYAPAGDMHRVRTGSEAMRCAVIETASLVDAGTERVYTRHAPLGDRFAELHAEYLLGEDASPLMVDELVHELFAETVDPERHRPRLPAPWVVTVRDLVDDGLAARLTLAELAEQVDRHPMHVARAFRQRYGCSVGAFARRRQLQRARDRLTSTPDSLSAIALACGYADQSHLTRAFTRAFGVPPGKFRGGERSEVFGQDGKGSSKGQD